MIIITSEQIEGMNVVKTIGLVKGSTIRARHLGRDIVAQLRGVVGGEITEYHQDDGRVPGTGNTAHGRGC